MILLLPYPARALPSLAPRDSLDGRPWDLIAQPEESGGGAGLEPQAGSALSARPLPPALMMVRNHTLQGVEAAFSVCPASLQCFQLTGNTPAQSACMLPTMGSSLPVLGS